MLSVRIGDLSVLFKELEKHTGKGVARDFLQKPISKVEIEYPSRGHHQKIYLFFIFNSHVCLHTSIHVFIYECGTHAFVCAHACRGLRLMSRIILSGFSSIFTEADTLNQTQNMPVLLISLVSLFWGSSIPAL